MQAELSVSREAVPITKTIGLHILGDQRMEDWAKEIVDLLAADLQSFP